MKKKQIKYIPIEPPCVRPGSGTGEGPDPDVLYVYPTPVNPQPQTIKHSNTEELEAVIQTGVELLSDLWWGGCRFFRASRTSPITLKSAVRRPERKENHSRR